MRWFAGAVCTFVLALALPAPALAQDLTAGMETYVLDNGLTVVLAPDTRVPKVAVTIAYQVGGPNEPVGRSGFAHLFEHLMFSGTAAYPDPAGTYSELGLGLNATTKQDVTTFWAAGLASALPVILSLEADRMANLGAAVGQDDLDRERDIVLNEMRQQVLDAPGAGAYNAIYFGLFPKPHPYSRAVLGSIPDVEAATLDTVQAFFNAYYAPNNAVLSIVGDFEIEAVRAMINDTFGRIARGTDIARQPLDAVEPARLRLEMTDALPTPLVYLAFVGPASPQKRDWELLIAADVLCNTGYGRVTTGLINSGVASYAGCNWTPGQLGGRFLIYAGAGAGVTAGALELAVRDAFAEGIAQPIDAAEIERAKRAFHSLILTAWEPYQTRSEVIAEHVASGYPLDELRLDDPELLELGPGDVEMGMRSLLAFDDVSVAIVNPGPRGDYPAVLSEPSGEAVPLTLIAREGAHIPELPPGEQDEAQLPEIETATLGNGIRVVHMHLPEAPMQWIAVAAQGGAGNDPRGSEGLHELAINMALRGGGGEYTPAELGSLASSLGSTLFPRIAGQIGAMVLAAPSDTYAESVGLLADVVLRPRWEAGQWGVLVAGTLDGLMQRTADLDGLAARALTNILIVPEADDPANFSTVESVGSLTLDAAKAAYAEWVVPAGVTIFSVGPLTLEDAVTPLEAEFGGWQSEAPGLEPTEPVPPVFPDGSSVYFVPAPGATQTSIYLARPAPGSDDPQFAAARAVFEIMAIGIPARLNSVIRVAKGYSYGGGGWIYNQYPDAGGMSLVAPVVAAATGEAVVDVGSVFGSLATTPIAQNELDRTIRGYQSYLAGMTETAQGLFDQLVLSEGQGQPLPEIVQQALDVTDLDLADVQAAAEALSSLDQSVLVLAGDPAVVLPQLEALGITEVIELEPF